MMCTVAIRVTNSNMNMTLAGSIVLFVIQIRGIENPDFVK